VSGVSADIVMEVLEDNGIAAVLLYIDGAFDSQATQTATSTWSATIYPHLLGEGPRALSAVAADIAGNQSATTTLSIVIQTALAIVTPEAPTNLSSVSFGSQSILTWEPPTLNTDGTPLTDLAGYNIYVATETNKCEHVQPVSGGGQPMCESVAGGYSVSAPALVFRGTPHNDNPLGGEGPVWLNAVDATLAFLPMPMNGSQQIVPGKTVFAHLLELTIAQGVGLAPGEHRVTAYSQLTHEEMTQLLRNAKLAGLLEGGASTNLIVAHTAVCPWSVATNQFASSQTYPLDAIGRFEFSKINEQPIENPFHVAERDTSPGATTVFAVTAVNESGIESAHSSPISDK